MTCSIRIVPLVRWTVKPRITREGYGTYGEQCLRPMDRPGRVYLPGDQVESQAMTGVGAPAEKAQPDAHRSPWHGSAREGDGQVGEGEEGGPDARPPGRMACAHDAGPLLSEIGAEPGPPLLEFGQLGPQEPASKPLPNGRWLRLRPADSAPQAAEPPCLPTRDPSRLRVPGSVPPGAAERRVRPVAAPACLGGDSGPGASRSRAHGWRGLIAGSMQHGAPLGHQVEEFDDGKLDAEPRAVAHHT
jgi:hypothetical protein